MLNVTVWNENVHEMSDPEVKARYPTGIHGAVAALVEPELRGFAAIRTATMDEPEHGLPPKVLDDVDVLVWWGHIVQEDVSEEVVHRVVDRVLRGMGLVILHSAHWSKIFRRLMGTSCILKWRAADDRELVWTIDPAHPIAAGVPSPIVIPRQEMYGEHFDIPAPDELVFVSSFSGGEVFRSGCCFYRNRGRIFYFSPGDQDYPVYHQPEIGKVIANGIRWVAPVAGISSEAEDWSESPVGWYEGGSA